MVVLQPVDSHGLSDVSSALQDVRQEYKVFCDSLSKRYEGMCSAADMCRSNHKQEEATRMQLCESVTDPLRQELIAKHRERSTTEEEANEYAIVLQLLEGRLVSEAHEQAAAQKVAEMEVEVTLRMRGQLEALACADDEVNARYEMLNLRAEHASQASRSEEESLQAVSVELARVRSSQIITEGALSNESDTMQEMISEIAAIMGACDERHGFLTSETAQIAEVTAKSTVLAKEATEEEHMTSTMELKEAEELEESRAIAEKLDAARSEVLQLARARTQESASLAEFRGELEHISRMPNMILPTQVATSSRDLDVMKREMDNIYLEHGQFIARGHMMCTELAAAQERRSALQRAVKAQEESYTAQQQSQRKVIVQRMADSRSKIHELNAAVASDKVRLEQDSRLLDETLQRIGSLQGELLCVEAAASTEAEALVAVGRDMEVESEACNTVRQRLVVTCSELGSLQAQQQSSITSAAGRSAASSNMAPRSDNAEAALRSERVETDVLDAMARAVRTAPGDLPGGSLAAPGTPEFARQLMLAQTLLEEWHQRELAHVHERGLSQCRSVEEQIAQQQARRQTLTELRQSELRSWSLDKEQLAKRLSGSRQEHAQAESNLLGEISRLESVNRSEEVTEGTSSSSKGGAAEDEEKASTGADGSELARMNASLRDTHSELCEQQLQLDAITRERDRLQAHLMMALERASALKKEKGQLVALPSATPSTSTATPGPSMAVVA